MNDNSGTVLYDSPEDITSVDLTIRAVSGNISPAIYANGRNQLPVEIIAKAMKLDPETHVNIVLTFPQETWLHILHLCHAESDEKLAWQGSSGWCYTYTENEYSREIITGNNLTEPRYVEPGDEVMTFYVYTDDPSMKRIAVSIDTDGGKHFTTADSAAGAERCSVSVKAAPPISYSNVQNLKIISDNWVTKAETLNYRVQQYGVVWNFDHNDGSIRRRKFTIVTANGYSIAHKSIPQGLSSAHKQKLFYHQNKMPHAFSLANQPDGGYLNSWFVVSGDGERGIANEINSGYENIATGSSYPVLYFSDTSSGGYIAGAWYYWPYTEDNGHETFIDEHNNISVVCFQLCIPDDSTLYWGKQCRPDYVSDPAVPVSITDIYGNEGTFNITFNSSYGGDIAVSP
ncbi:hypothetical protein [Enterobacter cancerogenus]